MLLIDRKCFDIACEALITAAKGVRDEGGLRVLPDLPALRRIQAIVLGSIVALVGGAARLEDEIPLSGFLKSIEPEFEFDMIERRVLHKPSGIWFTWPEYDNVEEWKATESVMFRDNPTYRDRCELAWRAKVAAIEAGMPSKKAR